MSSTIAVDVAPPSGRRRPGRPRSLERESEIHAVVLQVVADTGFEQLTFEEVARRARCSKTTLYRRWPTKKDMLVAAVKAGPGSATSPGPVDTGSLRGDLLALLDRLEASMRAGGSVSLVLLQAGLEDPQLCHAIEAAAGPTGARLPENVRHAAVRRGELPPDADVFAYEEVAGAALLIRTLNGLTTDHAYRELLVDAVLIPALGAGVPAAQAGIFSGAPTPAAPPEPDPRPAGTREATTR